MPNGEPNRRRSRRRSARLELRIPVKVSLADRTELEAETVTVSKHGAKIRLAEPPRGLRDGENLFITIPRARRSRSARVVWVDGGDGSYGIEISPAGSFWGVYFPVRDGEDAFVDPPPAPALEPPPEPICHESCSPQIEPRPVPAAPGEIESEPAFEGRAFEAMLTGMSVARTLFSEKTMCLPTNTREATALVSNLLGPGARIRISRLHDSAVGFARVSGVSRRREAGKWRIWVQFLG